MGALRGKVAVVTGASRGLGKGIALGLGELISYSVCKAGLRRLTSDLAAELVGTGVAVLEVWPPASTTEGVLADRDVFDDPSRWLPPVFTGCVVAALVAANGYTARAGGAFAIKDLAGELGVPVPAV